MRLVSPSSSATILGAACAPHCVKRWESSNHRIPQRSARQRNSSRRERSKEYLSPSFFTPTSCTVVRSPPTAVSSGGRKERHIHGVDPVPGSHAPESLAKRPEARRKGRNSVKVADAVVVHPIGDGDGKLGEHPLIYEQRELPRGKLVFLPDRGGGCAPYASRRVCFDRRPSPKTH